MLTRAFVALCELSPNLKKWLWKRWYDHLAKGYGKPDWRFMNYGYAYPDGFLLDLEAGQEDDRYSIQLYHYVCGKGDLGGRRVVEIGCGRGGGARYLHARFRPRHMLGIDYSAQAIALCRRDAPEGLDFRQGDAERLPLPDASVDVVVNIESSHCYGSMERFLAEVRRVLTPGGVFLMADLRQRAELPLLDRQLETCGLELEEREDITAAVLRSIELDDERKRAFIRRLVHRRLLGAFTEFAGVRASKIESLMLDGGIVYQRFLMRKTGGADRAGTGPA